MEVAGGSGSSGGVVDVVVATVTIVAGIKMYFKLLFYADATSDLAMRRVSLLRGSFLELVGMCTILRGQASCLNFFIKKCFRTLGLSRGNTKNCRINLRIKQDACPKSE